MGDLNDDMTHHLNDFRTFVMELGLDTKMYDDYYLLRFLRARKFNMDNTKLMFNNFITWRKENDVDNVLEVSKLHSNLLF
jgi:hypothetical protein